MEEGLVLEPPVRRRATEFTSECSIVSQRGGYIVPPGSIGQREQSASRQCDTESDSAVGQMLRRVQPFFVKAMHQ